MIIECEVSLGELVDKISILRIKLKKIEDLDKLMHITKEEKILSEKLRSLKLPDIDNHLNNLLAVNLELWKIEDDIRDLERAKKFNDEFIQLARQVYITNDKRFALKNTINTTYKSGLTEVKSYKKY